MDVTAKLILVVLLAAVAFLAFLMTRKKTHGNSRGHLQADELRRILCRFMDENTPTRICRDDYRDYRGSCHTWELADDWELFRFPACSGSLIELCNGKCQVVSWIDSIEFAGKGRFGLSVGELRAILPAES